MTKVTSRVALMAVVSLLTVVPPAFAAGMPGNNNNGAGASMALDCSLPANLHNPLCAPSGPQGPNGNKGPMGNNGPNGNNGPMGNNNGPHGGPPPGYKGPPSGTFNFNQQDRGYFDQRFRGYNFGNFGFFATLPFSIAIGTLLPHTYHSHLRPVPYNVYHYYPWFRGYLYFVDRSGDFVIVSPRTYKIVAVL